MDKMIKDFSKWVITQGFDCKMPLHTVYGIQNADKSPVFSSAIVQACWQAWQASRQELVVEFTTDTYFSPCKTELEIASDEGFNSAMKDVKAALDAAGVSYK